MSKVSIEFRSICPRTLLVFINLNMYSIETVTDKMAALWPFLGIVGEVVILSTIILIYEKNRVKVEMDDVLGDADETK